MPGKKLRPMRVLVSGGRETTLKRLNIDIGAVHCLVVRTLNQISAQGRRQITVIHGGASGVDSMANQWADATHTTKEVYPITKEEWDALGKSAGPTRNRQMLDVGKPDVVLAFPGGNGTADMIGQAKTRGVRCVVVGIDAR